MRIEAIRVALTAGVVALVAGSATSALDINGFLREKGRGDVALSFSSDSYDHFWVGDSKVADPGLGEVDTNSVSLWMAYGVTERVTLVATLPYVNVDGDGLAGLEESDLQDVTAMAVFRVAETGQSVRHFFVGAVGFRTPASSYEANSPVDVGDGSSDWLLRLVYQLRHRGFYLSQQIGFDLRDEDAPDGVPLHTEIGHTWGKVTVNGFYDRLVVSDGTDIGDPGFTFPSNREEYERAGGKVFVRASRTLGVSLATFTTLDGRNTGDTTGYSAGVNWSF